MRQKFAPLRNESGNAIVMALILAATVAGVVELNLSQVNQSSLETHLNRYQGTRNSVGEQLVHYSNMGATYRSSVDSSLLPANQALANCIVGSASNSCQGGVEQSVSIYYPMYENAVNGQHRLMAGPGPFGSSSASPAHFDVYGNTCTQTNARCPSNGQRALVWVQVFP